MSLAIYDALSKALQQNNTETFETILNCDGLPGDNLDYELLNKAVVLGNTFICHLLLDIGCSVCEFDRGARTSRPLDAALRKPGSWYDVVEKILNAGARVSDACPNGENALHTAYYWHRAEDRVVELLLNRYLEETNLDLKDIRGDGLRCLHIASAKASIDCVKRCLAISSVNAQLSLESKYPHRAGYSPLHFAVVNDRHDVAEFLCKNGADVHVQNRDGSTPIHLALERRNVQMIDILFEYDKKYENRINRYGLTHFMAACAGNNAAIVEQYFRAADDNPSTSDAILMSQRVPRTRYNPSGFPVRYYDAPNYYPFAGYSAFYFAVELSNCENLPLLFSRGAYCKLEKLMPIDVDCPVRRENIFALIRNHYADCRVCKRKNFVYKRLACSNDGIGFLNDVYCVQQCMRSSGTKKCCIYVGVILILLIFIIVMSNIQSANQETSEPIYEDFPKLNPIRYNY